MEPEANPSKPTRDQLIQLKVYGYEKEWMQAQASARGLNVSQLIRRSVNHYCQAVPAPTVQTSLEIGET